MTHGPPEQESSPPDGNGESRTPVVPADATPIDAGSDEARRIQSQLLKYVHDSHVKLAKVLEKSDRSEMVIQSTDALNRTFRRLHESQEQLAQSLHAERRRSPWLVLLSVLVAGCVVTALLYWMMDRLGTDVRREADRFASARDEVTRDMEESGRRFEESGVALVDAIDRGLAANRVLGNENRRLEEELASMRARLTELESGFTDTDERLAASEEDAQRHRAEVDKLRLENDRLRSEIVARDVKAEEIDRLVQALRDTREAAVIAAPPPSVAPAIDGPGVTPVTPVVKSTAPPPESPVVAEVNQFLSDAGVAGVRLLRAGAPADGRLADPFLEVRESGFPVGFHQAAWMTLEVDPTLRRAQLVLQDGVTSIRGVKEAFGERRVEIPAVLADSWLARELIGFVRLTPTAPVDPAPAPVEPEVAIDARPVLSRLNRALAEDGYEEYEFYQLGDWDCDGSESAALREVIVHVYQRGGVMTGTVRAKRCLVEVDPAGRLVVLRFEDGVHNKNGREVPFFRGRGDDVGSWTLRLTRADLDRWRTTLQSLADARAER